MDSEDTGAVLGLLAGVWADLATLPAWVFVALAVVSPLSGNWAAPEDLPTERGAALGLAGAEAGVLALELEATAFALAELLAVEVLFSRVATASAGLRGAFCSFALAAVLVLLKQFTSQWRAQGPRRCRYYGC
ncbi:hypothetical protein [Meiothermus sp.]|uniref:hypothetical protein n=1 Tax=Meiothermus sp. TaxID=1955249 RepID=UPI0021DBE1AA|nr:hypothetical protein [Meiothermus sp.]GIW24065.1 MAG: hypothetical protein KatS3mg069_0332 [Meiothermus sp.]